MHGVQALLPTITQDQKNNDCAEEINPSLETTFGDTQYFFLTCQDPNEESAVFEASQKYTCALVNRSTPAVLVRGGNIVKENELSEYSLLHFHMVQVAQK